VRVSKKFGFDCKRKKANLLADFSPIQGRYDIEFISLLRASGINI